MPQTPGLNGRFKRRQRGAIDDTKLKGALEIDLTISNNCLIVVPQSVAKQFPICRIGQ